MEKIIITNEELMKLAKESIPKILKDTFSSTYSNPLKNALESILESDDFKEELKKIILECYQEFKKDLDFKSFVKEAIVNSVVKTLIK